MNRGWRVCLRWRPPLWLSTLHIAVCVAGFVAGGLHHTTTATVLLLVVNPGLLIARHVDLTRQPNEVTS